MNPQKKFAKEIKELCRKVKKGESINNRGEESRLVPCPKCRSWELIENMRCSDCQKKVIKKIFEELDELFAPIPQPEIDNDLIVMEDDYKNLKNKWLK